MLKGENNGVENEEGVETIVDGLIDCLPNSKT